MIIISGNTFVLRVATTIEYNTVYTTHEVINKSTTINNPNPTPKMLESQSLKNRITMHEADIPTDKKMKEILTKTLASACLYCKKLFPTNFWMLSGRPIIAIFAKISEIEIKSENVPI